MGLPVLAVVLAPMPATDLAYHLRAGAEILDSGRIPAADTWTFTALGLPWTDQQWFAQVILELVERAGGWTGLVFARVVLVAVTFGCAYLLCRREGVAHRTAALITLGAFVVAAPALALRPQLFGMALFAICLVVLAYRQERPRVLWLIPLLTIVWANTHGSFFLAPALLGLACIADVAERRERPHRALMAAVLAVLAACLTPFGPAVWSYAVGLGANPEVATRISEWQPPTVRDVPGLLFFGSLAIVGTFLIRQGDRVPLWRLLWLGTFAAIALYAARGIAWWPLAAIAATAPLLGQATHVPLRRDARPALITNAILAGALVVAAIVLLPAFRPVDPSLGVPERTLSQAPSAVTGELRDVLVPGDRLLAPQPWSSWFEYRFPEATVAVDSRIELFPPEVWRDYLAVVNGGSGWEDILRRWEVSVVVAPDGADGPLGERLVGIGWQTTLSTPTGSVLVRPDHPSVGP